jgi:hypothetical protein
MVRPSHALDAAGIRGGRSRHYDPAFWLDYFRRVHTDAACLSAGGCLAFYPTTVPFHYRSKYLGDGDSFGEMVAGCRKLGMNVVARTDPHAAPGSISTQEFLGRAKQVNSDRYSYTE